MSDPALARLAYQQLVAAVELLGIAIEGAAPDQCTHKEQGSFTLETVPSSTMGNFQQRCKQCGVVVDLDVAHG